MKPFNWLKPKTGKEIPFLILISFLATFAGSRIVTTFFPDLFLEIKGVHVHHFAYGFILLAWVGFMGLSRYRPPRTILKLALIYGFALGIAFDEFAMWTQLEDVYYDRSTYDAIVIITLILLNVVYFEDFWKKWGSHLDRLLKRIVS